MRTRRVEVGEVELELVEAGAGGRPLLLLHGFTGAKEDFTDWLDPLGALGWHAVAPDHRGHGGSSKPDGVEAYSLSILAGDAGRLVDALGWDRYTLLGHSMGGFVAQRMALADPGRLSGLVLMDTGHGPVGAVDAGQAARAARIAMVSGMSALADVMARRPSPLDTPAHRRVLQERPGYAEFGDRKLRATAPGLYAGIIPEMTSGPDTLAQLAAMRPVPPTLVIVGEQDTPFLDAARRLNETIDTSVLAVIPDAGHSPQFENPEGWWEVLVGFLASLG